MRRVSHLDGRATLRLSFRAMLAGAAGALALGLPGLDAPGDWWRNRETVAAAAPAGALRLPADVRPHPVDPALPVTTAAMQQPMRFDLAARGVLMATGSIEQGASARLEAQLSMRGDAVRAISLDSAGGSLDDAMAMARTIRRHGLTTEIADGALCASSCPLLFAGGVDRIAGPQAVVGVHQFYATSSTLTDPAMAMADAQITIARISRHLAEMGVDPALWLHALDTPPRSLYYLTPAELSGYGLVTGPPIVAGR